MDSSLDRHRAMTRETNHGCNYCVLARATDPGGGHAQARQENITPSNAVTQAKLESLEAQLNMLARRLSEPDTSAASNASTASCEGSPTASRGSCSITTGSIKSDTTNSPSLTKSEERPTTPFSSLLPFNRERQVIKPGSSCSSMLLEHYLSTLDPLHKLSSPIDLRQAFATDDDHLEVSTVALKSATCFAAASVLHQDFEGRVGEPLWRTYANTLEASLARSSFLTQPSVTSLQALTIYLVCGRRVLDRSYVWSLTALLVRLAMKLKLHVDPESQALPLSDCEYRRRLWWHICTLDATVADGEGTDPLISERQCTTKMPAPIQDATMHVSSSSSSSCSNQQHAPDMFYSVIRFEITYYVRTILFSEAFTEDNGWPVLSADGKLSVVESLEQTLKDKYWSKCSCKCATYSLAKLSSKATISALKLKIALQSPEVVQSRADTIVTACTEILDIGRSFRSSLALTRWSWMWQDNMEWYAAAVCTIVLRDHETLLTVRSCAWTAIDAFFENWKNSGKVADQARVWSRLEKLKLDARKAQKQSTFGRGSQNRRRSKAFSMVDVPTSAKAGEQQANEKRQCSRAESPTSRCNGMPDELYDVFGEVVRIDALGLML